MLSHVKNAVCINDWNPAVVYNELVCAACICNFSATIVGIENGSTINTLDQCVPISFIRPKIFLALA